MQKLSMNDGILIGSLLYLSIDIQYEWQDFNTCLYPVHKWLLISYGFIITFRLAYIVGTLLGAAEAGDFLLDLRQKNTLPKLLLSFTWLIALPLFTIWTAVGTYWLWEVRRVTPQCLPVGVHLWFIIVWQVLSYVWIAIHGGLGAVAWVLERRLRRREWDLRQLEDDDVLSRWGQVSQIGDYTSLSAQHTVGLSPADINKIAGRTSVVTEAEAAEDRECPICLNDLNSGDKVRHLASCGHTFHRSCIDLWLLRRADCPLCKSEVKSVVRRCASPRLGPLRV